MKDKPVRKKSLSDVRRTDLHEIILDRDEREAFKEGIRLFNAGKFWDAHEKWEEVWRGREEESRIFFQGIIQAAAGYHLIVERPRPSGARKNLRKAMEKLDLFPDRFLGLDVEALRSSIRNSISALDNDLLTQIEPPILGMH